MVEPLHMKIIRVGLYLTYHILDKMIGLVRALVFPAAEMK